MLRQLLESFKNCIHTSLEAIELLRTVGLQPLVYPTCKHLAQLEYFNTVVEALRTAFTFALKLSNWIGQWFCCHLVEFNNRNVFHPNCFDTCTAFFHNIIHICQNPIGMLHAIVLMPLEEPLRHVPQLYFHTIQPIVGLLEQHLRRWDSLCHNPKGSFRQI